MTSIEWECECGNEFEIEAEVSFEHQHHPYGSTQAREDYIEFEFYGPDQCPECGEPVNRDAAEDRLIETERQMV